MRVLLSNIFGNSNIGLYCYCTDSYCLIPRGIAEKARHDLEEVLKVPVYEMSIAGTSLMGVFLAGNSTMLLVPEIAFEEELELLGSYGIAFKVIKSKLTALGNNILCNDSGCLVAPEYSDAEIANIKKALDVPVHRATIDELETIGSLARTAKGSCLTCNDIKDSERKMIENKLKVVVTTGTVNFGSPYIASAMVVNSSGLVIGEASTGVEVANADQAFREV